MDSAPISSICAGHGDNTDPFTFPRAEQCAAVAIDSLTRSGAIDPRKTILFGHSMGGAIAVRMADHDPVAATIALSPAPMTLPQRMPSNLLVIAGGLDLWPVKAEARALAAAAGGDRTASSDFAEDRAFQLVILPYATHTTGLVDRGVAHRSELWAMQALFPSVPPNTLALNLDLATYETFSRGRRRLAGAILGLIGLALLFPFALTIASKLAGPASDDLSPARPSRALAAAEGAVGALVAVLILSLGVPLRFLHLYAGDYLASLLLIDGLFLLALNWKAVKESWSPRARPILAAALLAFAIFLATGAWLNWQLADMWMNAPRWLRFAELLPIVCIFCFAEEVVLGAVPTRQAARAAIFHRSRTPPRTLARMLARILLPRERRGADSHPFLRFGGLFGPPAPRYRCVTCTDRLRNRRRAFWCYTRRLVHSSDLSTDLTDCRGGGKRAPFAP